EYRPCVVAAPGPGSEILSGGNKGPRERPLVSPSRANPDAWLRSAAHPPYAYGCCRASQIPAPARRAAVSPEVPEVYRQPRQETAFLCRRARTVPFFGRWRL